MSVSEYKSPWPWFGGKSAIASQVWRRFGDVRNFVDPFMGSLAMLFLRPEPWEGTETVNDADGFVSNFWRAVQWAPDEVAKWADWIVSECDLHSRHVWLRERRTDLTRRLEGDPEYYDARIAGWWCWGQCSWIGSGWCDEQTTGPWVVVEDEEGCRQLVHLGHAGKGVNRQRVHLGDAGQGVNRQLVHLGDAGLADYFAGLCDRLRRVRVCCGDWTRVCGPTPTVGQGLTAVFLDPPYADTASRNPRLYASDSLSVAHAVREWAIEHGDDSRMRIALCGYEGEHEMPDSWPKLTWKTRGGYASQNSAGMSNRHKERIWFSPYCLEYDDMPLFAGIEEGEPC